MEIVILLHYERVQTFFVLYLNYISEIENIFTYFRMIIYSYLLLRKLTGCRKVVTSVLYRITRVTVGQNSIA